MLNINKLCINRDQHLYHYNLSIETGTALLITGPSGQGKSTLLDAIGGYVNIESGSIHWNNRSIDTLPAINRPVSYLFQEHNLFDHLTIKQNLAIALSHLCSSDREAALIELDIAEQTDKFPSQLSGGQRLRASIIAATLRPEPILLLDEPFRELDPGTRKMTLAWCMHKVLTLNKTLIVVSHNKEDGVQMKAQFPDLQEYNINQANCW